MIKGSEYRLAQSLTVTRLPASHTPVSQKASSQISPVSTHRSTEPSTDDDDGDDEVDYHDDDDDDGDGVDHQQSSNYHTVAAADPETFEMKNRPTLKMEEGTSSGTEAPVSPRRIATR